MARGGLVEQVAVERRPGPCQARYQAFCEFRGDDGLMACLIIGVGERIFSAGWDLKAAPVGDEHSPRNARLGR